MARRWARAVISAASAHQTQFRRTFVQAQFVQHMVQVGKFSRRDGAGGLLAADTVYPAHDPPIKFGAASHRVVDPLPALEQTGQNVIDVANGKGVIRTEFFADTLRPGAMAMPQFPARIALPAKHHKLTVAATRQQHQHRVRLGKS